MYNDHEENDVDAAIDKAIAEASMLIEEHGCSALLLEVIQVGINTSFHIRTS